jgi:hypothetical protein
VYSVRSVAAAVTMISRSVRLGRPPLRARNRQHRAVVLRDGLVDRQRRERCADRGKPATAKLGDGLVACDEHARSQLSERDDRDRCRCR